MTGAALAFAFSAGMLASVNPCGFAMLPTFITYYLTGGDEEHELELNERLLRALWLGLVVTGSFLVVFVIAGIILSVGGHALIETTPWIGVIVGLLLIGLGISFLLGRGIAVPIPIPQWEFRTQGPRGMFLYGVAYAAVSLSCTLPIFLSVFATSLAENDWLSASGLFLAYSLGMGVVITTLALAAALFQSTVLRHMRQIMPVIKRVSAIVLILAGGYLVYYQVVLNPFLDA
jgi:cytochrome c biogenesis protein CcdA